MLYKEKGKKEKKAQQTAKGISGNGFPESFST